MLKALACDIDGTLTDHHRRIDTAAIECLRALIDRGVLVVLASGNTVCFLDALARSIGTSGPLIAENGGVYRTGYGADLHIFGDRAICWDAYHALETHFAARGINLELYSPHLRYSDIAFARSVPAEEVRAVTEDFPVRVLDTGFAYHIQSPDFTKGSSLVRLAEDLHLAPHEFMAIGDSENDIEMIAAAGTGVAVANAHDGAKAVAAYVASLKHGAGCVEAIRRYEGSFFTPSSYQ
ncbi:MAG: phosphoglycolate phosphatase [Methanobacteriota archaeon]|nr:MAG: phosphoglycolate phosphatase [Euryarchaeota archaeon]